MKNLILLSLIILSISWQAWAGPRVGNGGGAIVCRDPITQEIKSAELLDLYEGKIEYELNIVKSDLPVDEQIANAFNKIKETSPIRNGADYYSSFEEASNAISMLIHFAQENMAFIPDGTKLNRVLDASFIYIPKGCEIEQLAINSQTKVRLLVDKEIYQALPKTDKAAFVLHEAIYMFTNEEVGWYYREIDNSDYTRMLVAHLFSDTAFEKIGTSRKNGGYYCKTTDPYSSELPITMNRFYIAKLEDGTLEIELLTFNDLFRASRTTVTYLPNRYPLTSLAHGEKQYYYAGAEIVSNVSLLNITDGRRGMFAGVAFENYNQIDDEFEAPVSFSYVLPYLSRPITVPVSCFEL